MSNSVDRFLNSVGNRETAVDRAVALTTRMIKLNRGQHGTEKAAIAATAWQCRVSQSVIRRFAYPSRRPKSVDLGLWERIRGAYFAMLRRQLAGIQTEIARVEHLDDPDGAIRRLLDEAEAVADRIRTILEARSR